jgi:gluconolactonase
MHRPLYSLLWAAYAVILLFSCKNEGPKTGTPPPAVSGNPDSMTVVRFSPELDNIIAPDAKIEVLASGYKWSEGPLWISKGNYLLFTDVPANMVVKWKEDEGASLFLTPSGYDGPSVGHKEPGANGLTLDSKGNLVMCQHGNRMVARMNAPLEDPKATFTPLADKWQGKRFNSPNDVVFDGKGNLYFTDPPYGLPKQMEDPSKEIPFQGVYRVRPDGTVDLLVDSLSRPNGIAFSPDEKTLYVANSDPEKALWMAYDVKPDGTLANGRVFNDATELTSKLKGLPDGLKVNPQGIVFATGPGGVWVLKADGTKLGRIDTGQATANCAIGNDGKYLYMTAHMHLMRIALKQ